MKKVNISLRRFIQSKRTSPTKDHPVYQEVGYVLNLIKI
jgi:hypothetical protein